MSHPDPAIRLISIYLRSLQRNTLFSVSYMCHPRVTGCPRLSRSVIVAYHLGLSQCAHVCVSDHGFSQANQSRRPREIEIAIWDKTRSYLLKKPALSHANAVFFWPRWLSLGAAQEISHPDIAPEKPLIHRQMRENEREGEKDRRETT